MIQRRLVGKIYSVNNKDVELEDSVDMELHDAVDYIILKHISHGSKWQALFARFTTELSREEERMKKEKEL